MTIVAMTTMVRTIARPAGATVAAGAVTGVVLGLGIVKLGVFLPVALVGLAACWALLWRPAVTLALLVCSAVVFEDTVGAILTVDRWYEGLPKIFLGPTDILAFVLLGGVLLEIAREHDAARLTGPFTPAILLLAVATVAGLVTGRSAGAAPMAIFPQIRPLIFFVVLVPLAGYVLSKHERWRTALTLAAVLIPLKAATGLLTRLYGGELAAGQDPVTFYEPTMNLLMVLFLLTVTAAGIRKVHLSRWIWPSVPVVTLSLLLSFRRSFWVAAILGLVLVTMIAAGRRSRPYVVLGLFAVALALWAAVTMGGSTDSTNPIIDRAESLSPTRIRANSGDRYRLEEQRNVVAEIKAQPLNGLGLGIPWTQRYYVSESHPGGRYYSHVTPLWYWLKLGPLGVIAYFWLAGLAEVVGYHRFRRSRDPVVAIVGLAIAAGWVGLVLAELTGPFSGIDFRLTIVVACAMGWLTATGATTRPSTAEGPDNTMADYPMADYPMARR